MAENKKVVISVEIKEVGGNKLSASSKKATKDLTKLTDAERAARIEAEKLKITNNAVTASLKQEAAAALQASAATNKLKTNSGLNNAIIAESARLASDASYGFTAIANNLGQLVSLFSASANAAGGLKSAFAALFTAQSLFLIGIQLVITFGNDLFKAFMKLIGTTNELEEVFKNAGETVGSTAGKFEAYIRTIQSTTKSQEEQEKALKGLNEEFPDFVRNLKDAGFETENLKDKTNDIIKVTNQYRDSLYKLALSRAAQNEIDKLAAEEVNNRTIAENKLMQMGVTLDEAREISAKRDLARSNKVFKNIQKTQLGFVAEESASERRAKIIDGIIKKLDEENISIQERLTLLIKYVNIELDEKTASKRKKQSDDKKKYDMLEIGSLAAKIRGLKEMGRIRDFFFNKNLQMDVAQERNTIEAIKLEEQQNLNRLNALKEQGLLEGELAVAKYEINLYYSKLLMEEQRRLDEQGFAMRMEMFGHYADSLGSISQLMKENSAAQKSFALAEIVANTAIGFSNALVVAQEQSLSAPPVSTLAYPLFYASQIASVLAAAAKAKSILNGGSATGGDGGARPQLQVEAPDFNVVGASPESQLAQTVAASQTKPLRAFVVGKDITNQQELDRNIKTTAGLGN